MSNRSRSSHWLSAPGIVCALGMGRASVARALFASDTPQGVAALAPRGLHLGAVTAALSPLDDLPLRHRSRNNALLLAALAQILDEVHEAITRFGADRVAVVLGTSTSGIGESEAAWRHHHAEGQWPDGFDLRQQEIGSPALMLAELLGLGGPAHVISTACSSSAKALASAARMLDAGLCDAVITGGADSLCDFTVAGFEALESVSAARCNPMSAARCGINIGEAAALFVLTREPMQANAVQLAGWGETSDAHHVSAPEPSGAGALAAMQAALQRAGLAPDAIDYINLHGTATPLNDAMESRAVAALFGLETPCSSTKPLTGHTLGAAGALEAAICWLTLAQNPASQLPPHWWDGERDADLPLISLVRPGAGIERAPRAVLSNSFAFGGSNASLILARA